MYYSIDIIKYLQKCKGCTHSVTLTCHFIRYFERGMVVGARHISKTADIYIYIRGGHRLFFLI